MYRLLEGLSLALALKFLRALLGPHELQKTIRNVDFWDFVYDSKVTKPAFLTRLLAPLGLCMLDSIETLIA